MNLILAVTGASGAYAADVLLQKSSWDVTLVASRWGKDVYRRECGSFEELASRAQRVLDNNDMSAPIASGSVETVGMVVLPCSADTLGKIANGIADSLITRAAHCHLKEHRKIVLCVRESPWTLIDLDNARRVAAAGGIIMPISPPFYMLGGRHPDTVTMTDIVGAFVDRVLDVLGDPAETNWETIS